MLKRGVVVIASIRWGPDPSPARPNASIAGPVSARAGAFCTTVLLTAGLAQAAPADIEAITTAPGWIGFTAALQYALLIGVLAALLVVTLAIRQRTWALYAVLGMISCGWSAVSEQGSAAIFAAGVAIPLPIYAALGHATAAANFAVAAAACPLEGWRRSARQALFGLALVNILLATANGVGALSTGVTLTVLMVALGNASHLAPVSAFVDLTGARSRFAQIGIVGVVGLVFIANGLYFSGALAPGVELAALGRWFLTAAILFASAICLVRVFALQRDRERNLIAAAEAARREAAMSEALLRAERNYAEARDVARTRTQDLARASHDLRQPLISLRRNLEIVSRDQPAEMRRQIVDAFDYLDQLTASVATGESGAATGIEKAAETEAETSPLGVLLETLDRMFRAEAEEKGLTLTVQARQAEMAATPLLVMRILSNLVANAVRHTPAGRIEIVTEAPSDGPTSVIVRNAHPAPEALNFERLFAAGEKSAGSKGSGLGLAIARAEAARAGLALTVKIDTDSETPIVFRLSEAAR
ncbi:MAG: HAMP domain-containing sensor histidine kinase [Pseudomonadota bacterium]